MTRFAMEITCEGDTSFCEFGSFSIFNISYEASISQPLDQISDSPFQSIAKIMVQVSNLAIIA